jgi:hypothetical protein
MSTISQIAIPIDQVMRRAVRKVYPDNTCRESDKLFGMQKISAKDGLPTITE